MASTKKNSGASIITPMRHLVAWHKKDYFCTLVLS